MKGKHYLFMLGLMGAAGMSPVIAQDTAPVTQLQQPVQPLGIDNYQFAPYYWSGGKVYNGSGVDITDGAAVSLLKADPSGAALAVVEAYRAGQRVRLYDPFLHNKLLTKTVYQTPEVKAIAYSSDARNIAVLTPSKIDILSATDLTPKLYIDVEPLGWEHMVYNASGRLIAIGGANTVELRSALTGTLRQRMELSSRVTSIAFADDDRRFLVGTADGGLHLYDTQSWGLISEATGLGKAASIATTAEGKYAALLTSESEASIVNLLNLDDRQAIALGEGGATDLRFVSTAEGKTYLLYNTASSIAYRLTTSLSPYYSKMLATELSERLDLWRERRTGETEAEYEQRVNETTLAEQIRLEEVAIATRKAEEAGVMQRASVKATGYDATEEHLVLEFANLPAISLDVPQDEAVAFADPGQIEFRNVEYRVNADDQFEIVRADVYNTATGKTYAYESTTAAAATAASSATMIPLASYTAARHDAESMRAAAQQTVEQATAENRISENTEIAIDARPVAGYSESGQRSTDYEATFAYKVRPGAAPREDFAPGQYHTSASGAAESTLDIIAHALKGELSKYVKAGRQVRIKVTGAADALPINSTIAYDGAYGELTREPVTNNGQLVSLSLTRRDGITTNEQLALARAAGMKQALLERVPELKDMQTEVSYAVTIDEQHVGGKYRRTVVQLTFVDALTND